ncbi:MAG: type II toxin-antitoxin system RelE/ParE family toxin [Geobacter sp.]|nr:type II toxin-antitoxin system RelE/ParE family toxin [Geobacter sp.]
MKYELVIRPEAESELAEAFDWYEERMRGLGSEFLISVDAAVHAIARNPLQFAKIHKNVRRALLHRFPYGVFYLVEKPHIVVLAFFHVKRNPKRWQQRH